MAPVTNQMLNVRREETCVGITTERKYSKCANTWIKRSLRPSEWQIDPFAGTLVVPRFEMERIFNEAAAMKFIAEKTNIPVPKLYGCFGDDGAAYLVMEYIEGVTMNGLDENERKIVETKLEGYIETLRSLNSAVRGGPSGLVRIRFIFLLGNSLSCVNVVREVLPTYRVMVKAARQEWKTKCRKAEDLVFCHNDFSTHNVIVDKATLQVKTVIDWEYAGFYPREFEGMYFRRPGPSVALEGEVNDEDHLLSILFKNERNKIESKKGHGW